MREQFPSPKVVGIDDLTMAQIALERFQNQATPFTPADEPCVAFLESSIRLPICCATGKVKDELAPTQCLNTTSQPLSTS